MPHLVDRLSRRQKQVILVLMDTGIFAGALYLAFLLRLDDRAMASTGAFWGMLIGLLFFAPWLGLAIGAVTGAIAGKFTDIGVDDKFIKEVGEKIEPGHSAIFLLVDKVTMDKVRPTLAEFDAEIVQTSLSDEQEAQLRDVFSGHDFEDSAPAEEAAVSEE